MTLTLSDIPYIRAHEVLCTDKYVYTEYTLVQECEWFEDHLTHGLGEVYSWLEKGKGFIDASEAVGIRSPKGESQFFQATYFIYTQHIAGRPKVTAE